MYIICNSLLLRIRVVYHDHHHHTIILIILSSMTNLLLSTASEQMNRQREEGLPESLQNWVCACTVEEKMLEKQIAVA